MMAKRRSGRKWRKGEGGSEEVLKEEGAKREMAEGARELRYLSGDGGG